jgi:uncharacterized protein
MPSSNVIPADIKAVIPTNGGTALFLGNQEKTFLIFIDNTVGSAIAMHIGRVPPPRPQTHDLMAGLLVAMGAKLDRVVINDVQQETFFARIIVSVENELQEKKIIEMDARPSDSIALALRMEAPLMVSRKVMDAVPDQTELLRQMQAQQQGMEEQGE